MCRSTIDVGGFGFVGWRDAGSLGIVVVVCLVVGDKSGEVLFVVDFKYYYRVM